MLVHHLLERRRIALEVGDQHLDGAAGLSGRISRIASAKMCAPPSG